MKSPRIPAKVKITLWSITAVLLLYTLIGFVLLPAIVSSQGPKLIKKHLKREAQIATIHFNPFSFELSVEQFLIKNPDGSDFVRFERLYTNLGVLKSLKEHSLNIDRFLLQHPFVAVSRDNKGRFNFSDLLPADRAEEKNASAAELFPVTVGNITLSDGELNWRDHHSGQTQRETLTALNLSLDNLSTLADTQSDLNLSVQLASGGELTWRGELEITPVVSTGHIELNRVNLRRVWELLPKEDLPVELLSGQERIKTDYRLTYSEAGLQLQLNNAAFAIDDVQLAEKGQPDALITLPEFRSQNITFDLQKRRIELGSVTANNVHFKAWLNPDGVINYQALFASDTEEPSFPASDENTKQAPSWQVKVRQLQLSDWALHFTDKTLPQPTDIVLDAITLNAHDLSNQTGAPLPFTLSLHINDSGRLAVEGESVIEPLHAQLHVKAGDIAIADYQAYIDQALNLEILSGLFHADVDLNLHQPENQAIAISLQGGSRISEFASKDRISNRDFAKWDSLNLDGMKLDLAENRYSIETVSFDRPYARVLIRKDKSINVNDVVVKRDEAAPQPPKTEHDEQPADFRIGKVVLRQGETDFADLSLILPFSAHINQLDGTVRDVSSSQDAIAKVALAGKVDSLAPVNIEGHINPYKGDSEFALDFNSMPMPLMTPYMAEFAGRKIEKGNMSLGLRYKIENKQLTASNKLLIENLVLGDKVDNPQAVSLPLDFAIALLQDNEGKIALEVPITGSLEDPQFSTAGIIVDALTNVITKIVSSPFTALASLIDGDEDISAVSFPAGSARLDSEQRQKLDSVVEILTQRPKLRLEIQGAAFSERDWPALQQEALEQQLRQLKAEELKREFPNKALPENIRLPEQDYKRLLADLFIRRYPQLAERTLLGTPRLLDPQLGEFYTVAKSKLAADIAPDFHRLQQLADKRSKNIAKYLIEKGIPMSRQFLLNARVDPEDSEKQNVTQLNLTVN